MDPKLNRPPNEVARQLSNAVLVVNGRTGVMTKVEPRDGYHCQRYKDRPICRPENPAEVSVEPYKMGKNDGRILFIGTQMEDGVQSCVQVSAVEFAGQETVGPMKVCQVLGLDRPRTGKANFDGTVLTITWDD